MIKPIDKSVKSPDPAQWVARHGDFLYRYALSRLRDVESAEEVVQETFLAGLRSVDQYAGKGAERAWLLGILKRKIVDHVRCRNRTGSLQRVDGADNLSETLFDHKGNWRTDPRAFGPEPSTSLQRQEFWHTIHLCLETLPQRQADVFMLREIEGLGSEEICKELGISPSNLWVLLYRARLRLSQCIKSRWDEPE